MDQGKQNRQEVQKERVTAGIRTGNLEKQKIIQQ